MRNKLNALLNQVSPIDLSLNNKDSCSMKCANGLTCVVEYLPDSQHAFGYIPVSRLPNSDRARAVLLQEALSINLQLQKEDVLALVYDNRIDHVVVCTQLDLESTNLEEFDLWLGNLIQKGEYLHSRLIESGLQASLNQTQEIRRAALVAKQDEKRIRKKTGETPEKPKVMQPTGLSQSIHHMHLVKI